MVKQVALHLQVIRARDIDGEAVPEGVKRCLRTSAAWPNYHWNHIPDDVLPALRAEGVSDEQIDQMLVTNAQRMLEPIAPY